MVILTSFKQSVKYPGEKFSIARIQPKGFNYKELKFLAAIDDKGKKLQLKNLQEDSLNGYKEALKRGLKKRWHLVKSWLDSLSSDKDIILCCWCPYSESSSKQMNEYGAFACHSGLIGRMVRGKRPDIQIILDEDRQKYLIKEWRPDAGEEKSIEGAPIPMPEIKVTPVYSNKLKDQIVIVKTVDEAEFLSRNQEHVVYSEDEVKLLRGQKESLLSFVHEAKKILGPEFAHVEDIVPMEK
jgi:hypothetical protein